MVDEQVWLEEGEKAFKRGKDIADNKYAEGTAGYEKWREGWLQAAEYFDSLKRN